MKGFHQLLAIICIQSVHCFSFAGGMGEVQPVEAPVFIPMLKTGFEFTISALVLQPEAGNLGWSATTTVLPIPTPQWQINAINPDFNTGFHLGGGYIFNPGNDVQLNWYSLNTTDKDRVNVNPITQWVSPFSQTGTPPEAGAITGIADLKRARAKLNFGYNAVNLDIGKFINFGTDLRTRVFTGLSGVWIKEKLISHFYGEPKITFSLNNTSTFSGAGARLGLLNNYHFYHNFNLVGQIAGSFLMGKVKPAEYKFQGSSIYLKLINIQLNKEKVGSDSVTQIVPAIDGKVGISYTHHMMLDRELNIELGYMGTIYFNPLTSYETNTNVIALDSGSLSTSSVKHVQSNFAIGGFYLSLNFHC
ncbi:Lpg1974 family pore-forming outer membrane protein [Legionella sp. D16C41]|uniref:Lpg1974 family pore-forming outer membrane protein n=1 Tax=Legionella sp. D16C41 TaxID=3402688 RepID=UPI003AF47BED